MNKKELNDFLLGKLHEKGLINEDTPSVTAIQLVGDRDKPSISMKEYAFTISANSMSDRGQFILIREDE